ncbi:hypothetical protein Bca101_066769 [Brassica carinata]
MRKKQSKGELLYQQVSTNDADAIRDLHREGADLEWMDRKGRTPLIMACIYELYFVAKTLIELGANVNAYCPANPLVLNDDCQTPLEVARDKGFTYVVHEIEEHIRLFSGWMREFYGPAAYLDSHYQLPSIRVWVVVVPTVSRNPAQPLKLEVVVYDNDQIHEPPRTVMRLWKANLEEPITNHSDISVIIVDESSKTHLRLAPSTKGDEQQLKWFYDACKGIPQPRGGFPQTAPSGPPLHHAMSETTNVNHHSVGEASSSTAPPPPPPSSGEGSTSGLNSHESVIIHEHSPSAPPLTDDHIETLEDGPVHYPTIDSTPVDVPSSSPLPASAEGEKKEDGSSGQCSICLDAPSDVVCVPCGHLAGCMSCLTEIKSNNRGCPVCRAKIDQIIKLYITTTIVVLDSAAFVTTTAVTLVTATTTTDALFKTTTFTLFTTTTTTDKASRGGGAADPGPGMAAESYLVWTKEEESELRRHTPHHSGDPERRRQAGRSSVCGEDDDG